MTARELALKGLQDAEKQVRLAIAGLDAEAAETRTNPQSMTIREQIVHLAEAAVATLVAFEGGEYQDWGSWQPEDRSWAGVKRAWREVRAATVAKMPENDDAIWHAHSFLIAHDYYHVGQIAAARRVIHPEWDSYAIYGEPSTSDDAL